MATSLLLTLDTAVVKAQVSLGTVGGTISTADSDSGSTIILQITNPFGRKVELVSCVGERASGWLGRGRERFVVPINGLPHRFDEDGDHCLAWVETSYLPPLDGLTHLYVRDSQGEEWGVDNPGRLAEIRDILIHRR
jgi:hypothetical protein